MSGLIKRVGALALIVAAAGLVLPAVAQDFDRARGEALFDVCSQCHGAQGQGNVLYQAPAIAGLNQWYVEQQLQKYQQGWRGLHPDDLEGLRMRPMSKTLRSEEDVKTVSAYVASLPIQRPEPTLEGGDPARGEALYATCLQCHGAQGEGVQVMNGPSLNRTHDWYLLKQLKNFKSGVRGQAQGDQYGAQMAAMISALPDEQAMEDVVAYIQKLNAAPTN